MTSYLSRYHRRVFAKFKWLGFVCFVLFCFIVVVVVLGFFLWLFVMGGGSFFRVGCFCLGSCVVLFVCVVCL